MLFRSEFFLNPHIISILSGSNSVFVFIFVVSRTKRHLNQLSIFYFPEAVQYNTHLTEQDNYFSAFPSPLLASNVGN